MKKHKKRELLWECDGEQFEQIKVQLQTSEGIKHAHVK